MPAIFFGISFFRCGLHCRRNGRREAAAALCLYGYGCQSGTVHVVPELPWADTEFSRALLPLRGGPIDRAIEKKLPEGLDVIVGAWLLSGGKSHCGIGESGCDDGVFDYRKTITARPTSPIIMGIPSGGIIKMIWYLPLSSMALTAMLGLTDSDGNCRRGLALADPSPTERFQKDFTGK